MIYRHEYLRQQPEVVVNRTELSVIQLDKLNEALGVRFIKPEVERLDPLDRQHAMGSERHAEEVGAIGNLLYPGIHPLRPAGNVAAPPHTAQSCSLQPAEIAFHTTFAHCRSDLHLARPHHCFLPTCAIAVCNAQPYTCYLALTVCQAHLGSRLSSLTY